MADTAQVVQVNNGEPPQKPSNPRPLSRQQQLNKLYALPAPLRTFPLPSFVPHNPLSLFHILYVWLSQIVKPELSHYEQLYQGWFSPETRSVHVTDIRSIRGVWEHGFYGKGSLSRSEPSWLDREKTRRGTKVKITSEEVTRKRRVERQLKKWERARTEREAIDQKLLEEAEAAEKEVRNDETELVPAEITKDPVTEVVKAAMTQIPESSPEIVSLKKLELVPPVGPLELLLLPNSALEFAIYFNGTSDQSVISCVVENFVDQFYAPPIGPLELLALPNSLKTFPSTTTDDYMDIETPILTNGQIGVVPTPTPGPKTEIAKKGRTINGHKTTVDETEVIGGSDTNDDAADGSTHSEDTVNSSGKTSNGSVLVNGIPGTSSVKPQKTVRFSPTVEKNTFIQTEPPSPDRAGLDTTMAEQEAPLVIKDQEHTQLTLEEAFFLSYALGALEILDPEIQAPIPNQDLFTLFRKTSYFPPVANPILSPDDPFMINYVVYHHFRSLGWVPRSGIKFSCDLMLYNRGPVFSHAEFAVLILPSYSDPYWSSDIFLRNYVKSKEKMTWAWISCINRVITQVKKTLILVYVNVPKPLAEGEEKQMGIDGILERYGVREIVMKRWQANRMRN